MSSYEVRMHSTQEGMREVLVMECLPANLAEGWRHGGSDL
jgi:hypothetical protein